jgi:hypothetical protein
MEKTRTFKGFFWIAALIFFPPVPELSALEEMTNREMQEVTAQGGITLAVDDLVVFHDSSSLTFQDIGTMDSQGILLDQDGYITGSPTSLLIENRTFTLNVGSLNEDGNLIFDGSIQELGGVVLTQTGGEQITTFEFNDVKVWNHNLNQESHLGDFSISNQKVLASQFKFFSPTDETCGIRMLAETQTTIDTINFSCQDQSNDLVISGIMTGGTFTGVPLPDDNLGTEPIDTTSWAFGEDMFQLGIPHYENDPVGSENHENTTLPFSLDATDTPRDGITTPYLLINAPMQGSVRISNISSKGFDFGPIAIDGIRLYKSIIEFPGRGIGH